MLGLQLFILLCFSFYFAVVFYFLLLGASLIRCCFDVIFVLVCCFDLLVVYHTIVYKSEILITICRVIKTLGSILNCSVVKFG